MKQTGLKHRLTKKLFISKAKEIHGNKYDYRNVKYVNYNTPVCIICPGHGEFWQTPDAHLHKRGCRKCYNNRLSKEMTSTCAEFIEKARKIHGDKYDYSKVEYVNNRTKVCIICPKHGEFWQDPSNHLSGKECPKCNASKLEKHVMKLFDDNMIKYIHHYKNKTILNEQHLDFYLPDYNIAVECQGEQHFFPVDFAGKGENWTNEKFKQIQYNDNLKKSICESHGIKILYYTLEIFKKYNNNVICHDEELLKLIS